MDYYVDTRSRDFEQLRISGFKGHADFFEVLERMGLERIRIPTLRRSDRISPAGRIRLEAGLEKEWGKALSHPGRGDRLVLHSPPDEKLLALPRIIRGVKKRGCGIITVIFDLEQYYYPDYKTAAGLKHYLDKRLEDALFELSDVVVAHTGVMKDMLAASGIPESRIVCARTWDYLRDRPFDPEDIYARTGLNKPVVYCGNLAENKAGFAYHLDEDFALDLYGPDYGGNSAGSVRHKGVYRADELTDIVEASFGLVWDGPSADACTGTYGDYLRCNIPHKASFYLASGIPVIIWKEAAMADFIISEGCGIAVGSLAEISSAVGAVTEDGYGRMRENAMRIGGLMRQGHFIRSFIEEALTNTER